MSLESRAKYDDFRSIAIAKGLILPFTCLSVLLTKYVAYKKHDEDFPTS